MGKALLVLFALASGALLPAACAGELPGPRVCSAREACEPGEACVLGRCRRPGTVPASFGARREARAADDVAALGGDGKHTRGELEGALVLGPSDGVAVLLMRFAIPAEERPLERALLLLEPSPRCEGRAGRIRLEVAHVIEPWTAASVTTSRRPRTELPLRAGEIEAAPPQPLRLDVTELVRAWDERGYHGIALLPSGDGAARICFEAHPRLELFYAPPEKPDAGTDAAAARDGGSP